ncbi:MAG: aminoacyl-tRNA hydrolase [Alphaproteobacteria bacterium]|nr:aminoacyl-tRNA hydrolase [Alphaproteobacteria bacterium]
MFLVVGLGNPGSEYSGNRHNIGFMAVDRIVRRHASAGEYSKKFQGLLKLKEFENHKVLFLKPITWMNNSGQAVSAAAKFYKIPPEKIIVFHDELGLESGKIKIKHGGGAAGHNGLRSITAHVGDNYNRVRIGIGRPSDREIVAKYVLQDFVRSDKSWLIPLLDGIVESFPYLLDGEYEDFISHVEK